MVFHYVALAVDAWLALRQRAQAVWRALPGDLCGRLVLYGCGLPPAAGRPFTAGDGTRAILVEDPRTSRYLDTARIRISAQTLGQYVLAREPLSAVLVEHELEHVRQWQQLGPGFLPAYLVSSGIALLRRRDPYWANVFEERARERAARATADSRVNA